MNETQRLACTAAGCAPACISCMETDPVCLLCFNIHAVKAALEFSTNLWAGQGLSKQQVWAWQILLLLLAHCCLALRDGIPARQPIASLDSLMGERAAAKSAPSRSVATCSSTKQLQCRMKGLHCLREACVDQGPQRSPTQPQQSPRSPEASPSASPRPFPPSAHCNRHSDCRTAVAPYCIAGKCAARCRSDSHCKGYLNPKPYCLDGKCKRHMCIRDKHCSSRHTMRLTNPYCVRVNGSNLCRQCKTNKGCSQNRDNKACHPDTGTCVQCTSDRHCAALVAGGAFGSGTDVADLVCTAFRCERTTEAQTNVTIIECTSSSDCGPGTQGTICDNGLCVECVTTSDCEPFVFGNATATCQAGVCVECSSNSDCIQYKHPHSPNPVCVAGKCAECTASGSTSSGSSSSTCPAGLFGAQGSCLQGRCVECSTSADCPKDSLKLGGVCDQSSSKCVQCLINSDCGQGVCHSGVCIECSVDIPCVPGRFGVVGTCMSGQCIECNADAECAQYQYPFGPALTCTAGKCVECSADRVCGLGLFGANATCQAGRCVECTASKACPKDALKPGGVCQESTAKCIQCQADADCGKGTCVAGTCKECSTSTDCAPGLFNVSATCSAGVCVECSSDGDCAKCAYSYGPLTFTPFCSSGKCVECSSDMQCPAGLWGVRGTCKAGKCVECEADSACPQKPLEPGGICQTNAALPSYGKCVECRTTEHCKFALHPGKSMMCAASEGSCEVCVADSDCTGFAGVSGMGPYCVRHECATRGKLCAADSDCAYSGPCFGVAVCPNGSCVQGVCESGLGGLDSPGADWGL